MENNFVKCLEIILEHEGGFVDHPKDPGGATNKGVTLKTYKEFLKKDVSVDDLKNIPEEHLESLYKEKFWNKLSADELPNGLDLTMFDWAVNSGFTKPAKSLQLIIGAVSDGYLGPNSIKSLNKFDGDTQGLINYICDEREEFYHNLSTFETFGKGWLRRTSETREKALEMYFEEEE
ncbi:MAG: hypothetical protein CMC70_11220 [Flavobacteriaceae bacterium]|nr:hypothetical protein [Flavobacteriaceae bacterium]|tara:strand:- start:2182 stop:2712 length:531 start_codon:yes stop_codon:yes gene_type:complete